MFASFSRLFNFVVSRYPAAGQCFQNKISMVVTLRNSPKNSRSLLRNLQRFQTKRFLNKDRLFLGELNGIFRENSMRISDCRVSSILKTVPVSRDSIVCPSPENSYITKRKHHLESLGISEQRSNTLERFQ